MELYEAIYGRKSIRSFDDTRDISQELILKLLKAACQAPSAGNLQPWMFVVVRDIEIRMKLVIAAGGQSFVGQAPVVIVVCANMEIAAGGYRTRGTGIYAIQDTAAATENLLLAAYAEGLGSCWVGAFDGELVVEILSLPAKIRPLAMVPVGYPQRDRQKPPKREVSEVTKFL